MSAQSPHVSGLTVAVLLAASLVAGPAGATVYSYTEIGTIAAGQIDYNGVFGAGGANLGGQKVSFTYRFDTFLATAGGSYLTYNYLQYTGGDPAGMVASATVGGVTIAATSTGFSQITDTNPTGNPGLASTVDTAIAFTVEDAVDVIALRLTSVAAFSQSDLTAAGLGAVDVTQQQAFYVSNQGVGREELLYFTANATAVPEPAGAGALGVGILLVVCARCRPQIVRIFYI